MNNIVRSLLLTPHFNLNLTSNSWQLKNYLLINGSKSLKYLKQAHARLFRLGLSHQNHLLNTLLGYYFQFNKTHDSKLIFQHSQRPNISIFNTMIRGLISCHFYDEALNYYRFLRYNGLLPNSFTCPFVLKGCGRVFCYELGLEIHTMIMKLGFDDDVFVNTSLVDMYAKCGNVGDAHKVFDDMSERSVVSWTAIISGYIDDGQFRAAVGLFERFLGCGLRPDRFTLVRILSGCGELGEIETGEWIHRYVDVNGLRRNVVLDTALIDMYAKCGCMEKARLVFDQMRERDVVSWTAMIQGYVTNDLPHEAIELFFEMEREKVKLDSAALLGVLSACTRLGALGLGERAVKSIHRSKLVSDSYLGTALMDMYAKCGNMQPAWTVFKEIKERDIVVWNAVISGLSINGYVEVAFSVFAQMEKLGVQPNSHTILGLLSGCTHAGLVDEGRKFFNSTVHDFHVTPTIEHYGCMVDLLSRAGQLEEAYRLIQSMPMEPNVIVWGALLGGCRLHRNTHLAEHVLEHLVLLEPWNSGNYVLLSNIYSANNKWHDAERIRFKMSDQGLKKIRGYSSIEVDGVLHEFTVGDKSHPMSDQIYAKLIELLKDLRAAGYVPTTDFTLFDVEQEEKEHFLQYHSEKLAIAFGLISTPPDHVIRIVKNLRVCGDCHAAIKIISKITGREIVLRDTNRFHHFVGGSCSCRDYW